MLNTLINNSNTEKFKNNGINFKNNGILGKLVVTAIIFKNKFPNTILKAPNNLNKIECPNLETLIMENGDILFLLKEK